MRQVSIYLITCAVNGKFYVGKTVQKVRNRWRRHILDAKKGVDLRFYRAIRKYGPENFTVQKLASIDAGRVDELERFWIALLKTLDPEFGYNSTTGGEGGLHTEESREKIREASRRLWADPQYRERLSRAHKQGQHEGPKNPRFGRGLAGSANGMFGKKMSDESRRKMRENSPHLSGANHPMFGRHHTEETKAKMRASNAGKRRREYQPHTPETKARIAASLRKAYDEGRHSRKENQRRP